MKKLLIIVSVLLMGCSKQITVKESNAIFDKGFASGVASATHYARLCEDCTIDVMIKLCKKDFHRFMLKEHEERMGK